MRHLLNHSVYEESGSPPDLIPGDGLELLTGYSPVDPSAWTSAAAVHLPYAIDWYSIWTGRMEVPDDVPEGYIPYYFYGRDREDIVDNIRLAIECAAPLRPAYGVLHAGSANIDELLAQSYSDSDEDVLKAFAEIVNTAVSTFPKGEPPFRLVFENQWWPGLRMLDGKDYRTLCRELEFENWGLCLDTGHLLVTTQRSEGGVQAVELLLDIFDGYPDDMIDSIYAMHLHCNASAGYIAGYPVPAGFKRMSISDRITEGYGFVGGMDRHRPFSVPEVKKITDRIGPEFVNHEMGATDRDEMQRDYRLQRSFFI